MICIKCQNVGIIILRKKDIYCQSCFLTNINHKYRSSFGKNKIMKSREKVLFAVSGGQASGVLLDVTSDAMKLDTHKQLRIDPVCVHIIGCKNEQPMQDQIETANTVIDMCKLNEMPLYIVHLSDYDNEKIELPVPNSLPRLDENKITTMNDILAGMTNTARYDHLNKSRRKLLLSCAQALQCKYICTGETASTLAINMLGGIVIGRGSQIQHDVGFMDSRNHITILRPIRDVTFEEMANYIVIKKIKISQDSCKIEKSLQSAIETFVVDLQETFPATISTICKTADKVGTTQVKENVKVCAICDSHLQVEESKLTALKAIHFSSTISNSTQIKKEENVNEVGLKLRTTVFPYCNETLCYGCSRTCSEIKNFNFIKK